MDTFDFDQKTANDRDRVVPKGGRVYMTRAEKQLIRLCTEMWTNIPDVCSFCNVHFEHQKDYRWECRVDEQKCDIWCGKCAFNTLILCSLCDYTTCISHMFKNVDGDPICAHCVGNGNGGNDDE